MWKEAWFDARRPHHGFSVWHVFYGVETVLLVRERKTDVFSTPFIDFEIAFAQKSERVKSSGAVAPTAAHGGKAEVSDA